MQLDEIVALICLWPEGKDGEIKYKLKRDGEGIEFD